MNAQTLLTTLEELGVTVTAAGGKLRLDPARLVPGELVADLQALKPDLLALLKRPSVKTTWAAPEVGEPSQPLERIEPLPHSLERMVRSATNDALPSGVTHLSSGLVMDVNGYVLRWACCYLIGDRIEASRRLIEVYTALHGGKP